MSKEEILREKTSGIHIFADGTEKELAKLRDKIYSAMDSYASQEVQSFKEKVKKELMTTEGGRTRFWMQEIINLIDKL